MCNVVHPKDAENFINGNHFEGSLPVMKFRAPKCRDCLQVPFRW